MEIILNDFSFETDLLTTTEEIDKLLTEYNLKIKGLSVRVDSREYSEERTSNRAEGLVEEIQEITNKITGKRNERDGYTLDSPNYKKADIELAKLEVRLRELEFARTETLPASTEVENIFSVGESSLSLAFHTMFKDALEARKVALGFASS